MTNPDPIGPLRVSRHGVLLAAGVPAGIPSYRCSGHEERLAAHAARVACEDPEMRRPQPGAPAGPAAYGVMGIAALARATGACPKTVRRWVRGGRLRATLVPTSCGPTWRIDPESLAEFVRERTAAPG